MKTNNSLKLIAGQEISPANSKKRLQEELFQKIVKLSNHQNRTLNYFCYMTQRLGGRSMYMSQSHIAKVVGCTREWANKCIKFIADLGLIISKHRRYFYGWRTNVYALKINIFCKEIVHELYTHLSSLRDLEKKFTQLENVNKIILNYREEILVKVIDLPKNEDPPDGYDMTLSELRAWKAKNSAVQAN